MMYALRTQRWFGKDNPSGNADGMFVRSDGHFTSNKASAVLFDNAIEAELFVEQWYTNMPDAALDADGQLIPLFLVEVQVKPVIKSIGQVVRSFTIKAKS